MWSEVEQGKDVITTFKLESCLLNNLNGLFNGSNIVFNELICLSNSFFLFIVWEQHSKYFNLYSDQRYC